MLATYALLKEGHLSNMCFRSCEQSQKKKVPIMRLFLHSISFFFFRELYQEVAERTPSLFDIEANKLKLQRCIPLKTGVRPVVTLANHFIRKEDI